jgi:hypothetical protein
MLNHDGTKMSDEDLEDFKRRLEAQEAAMAATEVDGADETTKSDQSSVEAEL